MPLHRIYITPGTFTEQDKQGLAQGITKLYTSFGLPAFYVVVLFIEIDEKSYFIGGKQENKFVRISVQHIARQFESYKVGDRFLAAYESVLAPFIKERGYDWEVAVELIDRNYWRENGIEPPLAGSIAEQEWVKQDKALPYDPKDNVRA